MHFKAVTFNVQHFLNYVTRQIDMDMFEKVIRAFDADIVALNEVYGGGEFTNQVEDMANRLGYHWFFARAIDAWGEGPYGNGLLSRHPILDGRIITVPEPEHKCEDDYYETRCLLQAELDVPGSLQVNVIHIGLTPPEHENAVVTLCEHVQAKRALLMGDFNVTPDNVVLNPLLSFLQDTAVLLDETEEEKLSFPSDAPDMKIDYILHTPDITALHADIPAIVASDHRPHIAVFDL